MYLEMKKYKNLFPFHHFILLFMFPLLTCDILYYAFISVISNSRKKWSFLAVEMVKEWIVLYYILFKGRKCIVADVMVDL